jgi:hypothetical protein
MSSVRLVVRCAFSGLILLILILSVSDATAANPYHRIIERNLFGLRPRGSASSQIPRAPLPKITLTGITTLFKGKRALLKVQLATRPAQALKEQSLILAEGQQEGSIEVLEINEKTAWVKLKTFDTITNITFEKNVSSVPAPAVSRRLFGKTRLPRPISQ